MDALHRTLKHPCHTSWNTKYDSLKQFSDLQQRLPSLMDKLCRISNVIPFSSKQLWAVSDYVAVSFSRNSMPCTNTWERVWGGPTSPRSTLDVGWGGWVSRRRSDGLTLSHVAALWVCLPSLAVSGSTGKTPKPGPPIPWARLPSLHGNPLSS